MEPVIHGHRSREPPSHTQGGRLLPGLHSAGKDLAKRQETLVSKDTSFVVILGSLKKEQVFGGDADAGLRQKIGQTAIRFQV